MRRNGRRMGVLAGGCIAVAGLAAPALALGPAPAVDRLAGEFADCAGYYYVMAEGVGRGGGDYRADLERGLRANGDRLLLMSAYLTDADRAGGRVEQAKADVLEAIDFDYASAQWLVEAKGPVCDRLMRDPGSRMRYLSNLYE